MKKCCCLVQEKAVLEEETLKARRKKEKYNRNRNYYFMKNCILNIFLIKSSSAFLLWGKQERNSLKHLKFGRSQHMAPRSSTLAWKIPWTEEPGRLQSMESLRVGHNWETSLSLFTFMHGRSTWQPTPVFLPGESQGRGSLVGCRLWGLTESDLTEATQKQQQQQQQQFSEPEVDLGKVNSKQW